MYVQMHSAAVQGIDGFVVSVEVNTSPGEAGAIVVVGLPDAAVRESRDRVRAAIWNSGFRFPAKFVTVNLAPGDIRKEGPAFDLPIALGILGTENDLSPDRMERFAVVGELSLDGRVRPVRGSLPMALACKAQGVKGLVLPRENAREAAVVEGLDVIPVGTLSEAFAFMSGGAEIDPVRIDLRKALAGAARYDVDFSDVRGQEHVKRALTVAAAGGHNVLMIGPPGTGKTMLAQRIPTILPPLKLDEALETTKIYSVAGLMDANKALLGTRPFRTPHHTISDAGLVGGGTHPRPGEVSLAHNGVLFLDELPEFSRRTLEVLRQPLEEGRIVISRASGTITYPSRVMLVCAMNPCPCGYYGDDRRECRCTPYQIRNYLARISGPLLDRIDIHVEVPAVPYRELSSGARGEPSEQMRAAVCKAREVQVSRFGESRARCNAAMSTRDIQKHCRLDGISAELLRTAMSEFGLSARAYNKVLKVARTIADLDGQENIQPEHVSEAINYRTLDRKYWE